VRFECKAVVYLLIVTVYGIALDYHKSFDNALSLYIFEYFTMIFDEINIIKGSAMLHLLVGFPNLIDSSID